MTVLKVILHLGVIVILTILTQVGGIIWLIALVISKRWRKKKRYVFPIIYLTCNLFIIPLSAPLLGRTTLPIFNSSLHAHNFIYPLLFRNYVSAELKSSLIVASKELNGHSVKITYLDANFPFINGFPLLPHLSHNDGNKIDISFMYLENGKRTEKKPSRSGYGAFTSKSNPTSDYCLSKGFWQYDITKHITFGTNENLTLDKPTTKLLIQSLIKSHDNPKIFIEPSLKEELGLESNKRIRFHGCQAVRHDDHIHFEIK